MSANYKQLLKFLVVYVAFWFAMTQINSFSSWISLYFPIFWVFVFFPAMLHAWQVGFPITLLCGLFVESQFEILRGIYLPLMLLVYCVLLYRRSKVADTKNSIQIGIASLVHWVLVIVPSCILDLRHEFMDASLMWQRTFQDGLAGQLALFIIFPILSVTFGFLGGSNIGDEGNVVT